jgi:GFO/IDH/MocA oxidoreductase family protein
MKTWSLLLLFTAIALPADIRVGIVGTDTSHVTAFTKILNDAAAPGHIPGARVIAAYKGGTDLRASATRVDKFAADLQSRWGVEIVPDIPTLCKKVDAILLESVDGRVHLQEAKQVIAGGKPMFIDKPLAATLEDAREIARLAAEAHVPWFSSSSERFNDIAKAMKFDDAKGVITWSNGPLEPRFPLDLSWYAIHPIELLYTLMGPGCEEVTRLSGSDGDLIVGRWKDGRLGSVRALRSPIESGAVVFRPKVAVQSDPKMAGEYDALVREIVKFFQTGAVPVSNQETLEIFAFMDAAQRSKAAGGQPTRLR